MVRKWLLNVTELAGLGLIVAGVWHFSTYVAVILAGVLLVAIVEAKS